MIKVVLLEREHFPLKLLILVKSFQVLLSLAQIFHVLVCNVGWRAFLLHNF